MSKIHQIFRSPTRHQLNSKTLRLFSSEVKADSSKPINPDVPGLSSKVLKVPSGAVGPGASKTAQYKNPEYFSYDQTSYFEAELEMLKFRLPQPSNKANNS